MIRRVLERFGPARTAAGFLLSAAVMIPLLFAYYVVGGERLPPQVLGWGTFFVLFVAASFWIDRRYPSLEDQARDEFYEKHPDETFEAQLAAVGGDETKLPPGTILDTKTPELWVVFRWSLVPAVVVAAVALLVGRPLVSAVLGFSEVVVAIWLVAAMFGPLTGRVSMNDFRLGFIYESRSNAATARAMAFVVLPIVVALMLHSLVLLRLLSLDLAVVASTAVLAVSAVLVVLLFVFGWPRQLLPAVIRTHGPHTLWAPVPPPPYGAGKRSRPTRDANTR